MDPSLPPQQTTAICNGIDIDSGPKDPTIIIKGKRTKRQRPTIFLTHSSTSYNTLNSSPTSSSNFPTMSTTTEDEDTAKCLILLSKGSLTNINNDAFFLHNKFTSKKYIHDGSITTGGIYVYECKTCSRTFSSFQALGGHRASHKKPKINEFDKRKPPPHLTYSEEDEPLFQSRKNNSSSSSSISIQINQKKSSSKLHECSICGAEFNSGQALGGHMRRHRVVMNGNTTTTSATVMAVTNTDTTLSLVPYNDQENNNNDQKSRKDGLFFDLDLNLPAPQETTVPAGDQEEYRETSFKFMANQNNQQPAVHLSATPTLVDCHY